MNLKGLSRLGATMAACALVACSAGNNGPTMASDRASITLTGLNGSDLVGKPISLTFTLPGEVGTNPTYYGLALSDSNQFVAIFDSSANAAGTITLAPTAPLQPGTSTGNITFQMCTDEYCAHVVATRQFPYTVTMFQMDTTALAIQAPSGSDAQVRLAINPRDTKGQLVFTTQDAEFLAVDHSDASSLAVTGSGRNVADGTYNGLVDIAFMVDGTAQGGQGAIPVTVSVGNSVSLTASNAGGEQL
jgi:hypothetical protein